MRNVGKGTREIYIKPFRLSYIHKINENIIYILDLYHKKSSELDNYFSFPFTISLA